METVVHKVRDLSDQKRAAAEQLVGYELRENQQLTIQVCEDVHLTATEGSYPDKAPWSDIYEGLSQERIDELDESIRQRANLTRTFE